ncbi:MAG: hypothetical protein H9791_09800 [Candidatus Bacteroides intestinipullorum]|uniref:Uncharacterized protein n=1 Tax=Candidatus Bacteroides intestinipullorum TaxID=2838471 RepID=A0A9E2NP69_9BACE|nr:hypothetical protein [Candidatus Bacteroides intestinipullorum]
MEDILKFLLVAAVLIVAFVRQAKKEARKQTAPPPPVMPQPEITSSPLPEESKDQTYGGYIPEGPAPEPQDPPRPKAKRKPAQTFAKTSPKQNISTPPPPTATPVAKEGATDYQIRSAEEARRAIIWGEILTRKY